MGIYNKLFIVIVLIVCIVFTVLAVKKTRDNILMSSGRVIYPFYAKLKPNKPIAKQLSDPSLFNRADGTPQIQCPAGTKINILGAFYDITDTYNQCVNTIDKLSPNIAWQCDRKLRGNTECGRDVDCGGYAECDSSQKRCRLKRYEDESNPGERGRCRSFRWKQNSVKNDCTYNKLKTCHHYNCVNPDICQGDIQTAINPVCAPSNQNAKCAIRDASANIAEKCDGRESCDDLTFNDFGDRPCLKVEMPKNECYNKFNIDGSPAWNNNRADVYCKLPYTSGYGNGESKTPEHGDIPIDPNGNLGYSVHGIYTCVADI